jgi:hypothetical protein
MLYCFLGLYRFDQALQRPVSSDALDLQRFKVNVVEECTLWARSIEVNDDLAYVATILENRLAI